MTKDTGGQAFPVAMSEQTSTNQYGQPFQSGMTLRDWFAGQAFAYSFQPHLTETALRNLADQCYRAADAMLAAREVIHD